MIYINSLSHHENEKHTEKNESTKIKTRNYVVDNGEQFIQHVVCIIPAAGFLVSWKMVSMS